VYFVEIWYRRTGGSLGFDLWPREKCPKEFNFSPKVTL